MTDAAAPGSSGEPLELRARPRPVRRFNKRALFVAAAGAALLIAAAAAVALAPPRAREEGSGRELYNTRHVPQADTLAMLPASYADLRPEPEAPALGPPLPGDLGAAILRAERDAGLETMPTPPTADPTPFRSSAELDAEREARLRAAQMAEDARESGVFFQLANARGSGLRAAPESAPAASVSPFEFPFTGAVYPEPAFGATLEDDPGRQARKLDFLDAEVDAGIYNPHGLQDPVSPYQVMAGAVIPASLVTGINSDLPGTVIAQVTENVYDTPTGSYLLIPQGARLIGVYDSVIAFGQSRALLVWRRIVFPDGSSIVLDNLPASDAAGYAGLEDEVDFHTWRLLQGVVLSTLLGVGTELTFDDDESDLVQALRESAQGAGNQAGQRIVNRALNIQPTITVRPGWPLRVMVNRDLVLRPYGG
jgi:type IV secretory pathway VirB10-like protein